MLAINSYLRRHRPVVGFRYGSTVRLASSLSFLQDASTCTSVAPLALLT